MIALDIFFFILGLFFLTVSLMLFFTYESEDKILRNKIVDFWIKTDDYRVRNKKKTDRLISNLILKIKDELEFIYGEKLISNRSLTMYFLLSLTFSNMLIFLSDYHTLFLASPYSIFQSYYIFRKIENNKFFKGEFIMHIVISIPFYFLGYYGIWEEYCSDCVDLHVALLLGIPTSLLLNLVFISMYKILNLPTFVKIIILFCQVVLVAITLYFSIIYILDKGEYSNQMKYVLTMNLPAYIIGLSFFVLFIISTYYYLTWTLLSRMIYQIEKRKILNSPKTILLLAFITLSYPLEKWGIKFNLIQLFKEIKDLL